MNKLQALEWLDGMEQAVRAARRIVHALPDPPEGHENDWTYESIGLYSTDGIVVNLYDTEQYKLAVKALGGDREKINNGSPGVKRLFWGKGEYNKVGIKVYDNATVCEKVQVGTRIVPAQEATPAVEEHEVPVYEWRCAPINTPQDEDANNHFALNAEGYE